jgi:nucleoside-diphosphate-sugar epimerase
MGILIFKNQFIITAQPPKTILVTRAASFIGRHLCERLFEQRLQVTIIDSVLSFYEDAGKRSGYILIISLKKNKKILLGSIQTIIPN